MAEIDEECERLLNGEERSDENNVPETENNEDDSLTDDEEETRAKEEIRAGKEELGSDENVDKAALVCSLLDDEDDKSDEDEVTVAEELEMETYKEQKENHVVNSRHKENDFEVEMNYTPDSDRAGLEGQYILHFGKDVLELLNPKGSGGDGGGGAIAACWSFRYLRRIGYNKAQNKFLIDAGRKCGEFKGVFDFSVRDDPRDIIEAMNHRPGCDLKLAENSSRISTLIY